MGIQLANKCQWARSTLPPSVPRWSRSRWTPPKLIFDGSMYPVSVYDIYLTDQRFNRNHQSYARALKCCFPCCTQLKSCLLELLASTRSYSLRCAKSNANLQSIIKLHPAVYLWFVRLYWMQKKPCLTRFHRFSGDNHRLSLGHPSDLWSRGI